MGKLRTFSISRARTNVLIELYSNVFPPGALRFISASTSSGLWLPSPSNTPMETAHLNQGCSGFIRESASGSSCSVAFKPVAIFAVSETDTVSQSDPFNSGMYLEIGSLRLTCPSLTNLASSIPTVIFEFENQLCLSVFPIVL